MHGTNVQAAIVAHALLLIAMSRGSSILLEQALLLQAITNGSICLPDIQSNPEMPLRMARTIWDTRWSRRAYAALEEPYVQYLAAHFYSSCCSCVKVDPNEPDKVKVKRFLTGVVQLYHREPSMQIIANALLDKLALPEVPDGEPLSTDIPRERFVKYCRMIVEMKLHIDKQKRLTKAKASSAPAEPQKPATPEHVIDTAAASVPSPAPEPRITKTPPANATPARTPPPTDVMCVVVPWSNCTSIPIWSLWASNSDFDASMYEWVPIHRIMAPHQFMNLRTRGQGPPS